MLIIAPNKDRKDQFSPKINLSNKYEKTTFPVPIIATSVDLPD